MMKMHFLLISLSLIPQVLSTLLIFGLSTSSSLRCWIGIVDQINPPWLIISKESNEQIEIPLAESEAPIKEGDWVIYWTQQKRLERLDSPGSRMESKHHQHLIDLIIQLDSAVTCQIKDTQNH